MLLFLILFFGLCRDASNNTNDGLYISVNGDGTNAQLNMKGHVTFNSNGAYGMYADLFVFGVTDSTLEVKVESDANLTTCENVAADIYGNVESASATAKFLGTGYTCNQTKVEFTGPGAGNVDKPTCQACD